MQFKPWIRCPPDLLKMGPSLKHKGRKNVPKPEQLMLKTLKCFPTSLWVPGQWQKRVHQQRGTPAESKEKHVITVQSVICKLVLFNDLTMLWSFLQNTFSSRPFRYSSRYFCGSKAEDDFVVAKYNALESVKRHITCKHGNKSCAENMWVLNTDVSRPGAKGALAFVFVSGTILLEVLLVRSVPCRLGISSDMALSCCLSFVNLWKKCKYWKCLSLFLNAAFLRMTDGQYSNTLINIQTLTGAANESSSCAYKGLDAALGSVCISSSLSSGRGRALAAPCRVCLHGPDGAWRSDSHGSGITIKGHK